MLALWYAEWWATTLWTVLYLVLLFVGFMLCFRKGHLILFLCGFLFPPLWFLGAIMPDRRARRERRND